MADDVVAAQQSAPQGATPHSPGTAESAVQLPLFEVLPVRERTYATSPRHIGASLGELLDQMWQTVAERRLLRQDRRAHRLREHKAG